MVQNGISNARSRSIEKGPQNAAVWDVAMNFMFAGILFQITGGPPGADSSIPTIFTPCHP